MSKARFLAAAAAAGAALLAATGASAQGTRRAAIAHAVASAPAQSPAASAPAPTSPAPSPAVVSGQLRLVVQRASGNPPFVIAPGRMVVRGIVVPYVAAQRVKLSIYRDGRKVEVKTVPVLAVGTGAGQFQLEYSSARTGLVQVRAVHYATPGQGEFAGRSEKVRFASPDLAAGAQGASVWLLQSELSALHYVVPLSGVFDGATARAVIAYRKLAGLQLVGSTNTELFKLLQRGVGSFHVRYRSDGRHVEADLTRQVLAEIEPGGHVRAIYTMSSGKPSTPTVIGRFSVYSKTPGVNSEGMVDSNYFIRGYAIHGYAEVPNYAASHGCLRVPIPNAASIFGWVQLGTRVDVYNEGGGGSHRVSSHAGP
jgi:L,D-transpeptidase catalytic domain